MPPSLVNLYTPRVGTQILLTDLHYGLRPDSFNVPVLYRRTLVRRCLIVCLLITKIPVFLFRRAEKSHFHSYLAASQACIACLRVSPQ